MSNKIEVDGDTTIIYGTSKGQIHKGYIDTKDFESVCLGKTWSIHGFDKQRSTGYFVRYNGLSMHQLLIHAPEGMVIDHINGNGLDNRRCNLRVVTHRMNMINRKVHKNSTSGTTGVTRADNGLYKVATVRKFINKDVANAAYDEIHAILNRYALQDEM